MKVKSLVLIALAATSALAAGPVTTHNLVVNGNFDDPKEPLKGWQHKYDQAGESWYKDNDRLTSVVDREGGRDKVLRLNVETQFLADNPGVKVDSWPIQISPNSKVRLSA